MAVYGVAPGFALVLLPLWIACAAVLALSAGLLLSALNVQYRDVGHVVGFGVQLWLFVSPIVFASASVTGPARVALALNPVTGIVDGMRWSLVGGAAPPAIDLLSLASGLVLAVVGLGYFQRVEPRFADLV
jgi:lipopolysaccharide transport system permease protein